MEEHTISYFSGPITNNKPTETENLQCIYEFIRNPVFYKSVTEKIRHAPDKDTANTIKTTELSFVTFSGTFNKRRTADLVKHSGYLCLDLDDLSEPERIKKEISEDNILNPLLIFTSPSGNGLKVVVGIDINKAEHNEYFEAITIYFEKIFGIEIDKSGRDVSRACFLCHDPHVYFNNASFLLSNYFIKQQFNNTNHDVINTAMRMIQNSIDGEKHDILLRASNLLGGIVTNGEISEQRAEDILVEVIKNRGNIRDLNGAIKTIRDGIKHGMGKPLQSPKKTNIVDDMDSLLEYYKDYDIRYILKPIIIRYGTNIIGAERGTGKTRFALSLAFCMIYEVPEFLGYSQNCYGDVLFLNFEIHNQEFSIFLKQLKNYYSKDFNKTHNLNIISFTEHLDANLEQINIEIGRYKPDLVIVDSLKAFASKLMLEKKNKELNNITVLSAYRMIDQWKNTHNTTVVITNHTNKYTHGHKSHTDLMYGPSSLFDYADQTIMLRKTNNPNQRLIIPDKSRYTSENELKTKLFEIRSDDKSLWLELLEDDVNEDDYIISTEKKGKELLKQKVKKLYRDGLSQRNIKDQVGCSLGTVNKLIHE